ncbi:MAG: MiaB/RimO family radical SAM methylthiotransferase [Chlorobiaceae bacterium]|nr:MiaB/RimO family radical SAM methylthiotransferase [Chlorobiaceae bacterium]NTV17513.1 MiaB/RimO family radical SAM methylthiotransferase [Chlorobiaceae bacterium]
MKNYTKKSVAAVTLGCKLNYSETSTILDNLCKQGWKLSSIDDGADLIIIHTCALTKQAEQKCRQKIRSIIRKNPESRIAVIGCYSQFNPVALSEIDGIDAILGSNDKFNIQSYSDITFGMIPRPLVKVTPEYKFDAVYPGYSLSAEVSKERTRAFLKIQDGCDYGCSYCVIPLVRGRSRSIPAGKIVERAHLLALSGYREIVLTGVNIGDYRCGGLVLCDLLRMLEEVSVSRIRISSIEPDMVDRELISLVAGSKKVVPHFHIPLQSGADTILKAMRRRYDTALYRERVLQSADRIAGCTIGADVMVGYPGETEEDFIQMYRFIEQLPLAYLHVFSCSVRSGTLLARQIETQERKPVKSDEIARRYKELVKLGSRHEACFKSRFIGKECMVLFEGSRPARAGIQQCSGYSRNYLRVLVESADSQEQETLSGNELPVLIDSMDEDLNLKGRVLS